MQPEPANIEISPHRQTAHTHRETLKFCWDCAFEGQIQVLKEQGHLKTADFGKNLVWMLLSSVKAYREVGLGLTEAGDSLLHSKVGNFISKLSTVLGLAGKVPLIGKVCTLVSSAGQFYCGLDQNHMVRRIISNTSDLYTDQRLADQVVEAVLLLISNSAIIAEVESQQLNWTSIAMKALVELRDLFLEIVTRVKAAGLNQKSVQFTAELLLLSQPSSTPFQDAARKLISEREQSPKKQSGGGPNKKKFCKCAIF